MNLPGLPEGVEAVRWGKHGKGEFFACGKGIFGQDSGLTDEPDLVVRPAPGYEFRYDVTRDAYRAVKVFPQPVRVAVQFKVNSESDLSSVREAVQKLNGEVIAQWPSAR